MTWPSGDPNNPYGRPPPPPPPPSGTWPPPQAPPPPPMPYGQSPYGAPAYGQSGPGYPYTPPKKSKKPLIIGLSVLGVLILLGVGVLLIGVFALKDTTIATNMKVGDCITDLPTDARVMTLPTTDCAQPHAGEVYAVVDMPDGDYPGQSKIDEYQNKCPDELVTIAPDAIEDDSIGIYVLYPTPETWEQDDRAITCIATFDPKRSGSLKN